MAGSTPRKGRLRAISLTGGKDTAAPKQSDGPSEIALRKGVVDACRKMNEIGINQGTSGNVSARHKDGILISPSAMPYDKMAPKDIVFVNGKGQFEKGKLPSVEWHFHLEITKSRPDVGAVVHTHSQFATIVSICRESIPSLHYIMAAAGGPDIRCATYATYGTKELAKKAVTAIKGRNACLLANHGVIAVGTSLERALWLANEVEVMAKQYVFTQLLHKGHVLGKAEIKRVMNKIKEYGSRS